MKRGTVSEMLYKTKEINFEKTRTQGIQFRDIIYEPYQKRDLNVLDHFKSKDHDYLLRIQKMESFEIYALLLNLCGDWNIGSMIRTSALSGIKKVFVYGRRRYDRRSSVGAEKYIDVEIINGFVNETIEYDINSLKSFLDKNRFIPIYAEHGGEFLGSFSWKEKLNKIYSLNFYPLIIMGNESRGIPEYVMNFFDNYSSLGFRVSIPQRGVMRSFNVGHAYSIILWDLRREMNWI